MSTLLRLVVLLPLLPAFLATPSALGGTLYVNFDDGTLGPLSAGWAAESPPDPLYAVASGECVLYKGEGVGDPARMPYLELPTLFGDFSVEATFSDCSQWADIVSSGEGTLELWGIQIYPEGSSYDEGYWGGIQEITDDAYPPPPYLAVSKAQWYPNGVAPTSFGEPFPDTSRVSLRMVRTGTQVELLVAYGDDATSDSHEGRFHSTGASMEDFPATVGARVRIAAGAMLWSYAYPPAAPAGVSVDSVIAHGTGVPDYGPTPPGADSDGDGLSNEAEPALGTNPALFDTDSDGLGDGEEVSQWLTDPLIADSDGDTFPDGHEVRLYTDPGEAADHPSGLSTAPRGLPPDTCFSQTFRAAPGAEWQPATAGAGSFTWNTDRIDIVATNNSGGATDEYYRTQEVPAVTEAHDFAFHGRFKIVGNDFGSGNHNALLFGLGNPALSAGSFRQGVAVLIESMPDSSTLRAAAKLGPGLQSFTGSPVILQPGSTYSLCVKHSVDVNGRRIVVAEVYDSAGSFVGASTVTGSTGFAFSANRLYFANDSALGDGGALHAQWFGVGIDREVVPVFNTKFYQNPLRAAPGDLLQICGSRFSATQPTVVYQRVTDIGNPPATPPIAGLLETVAEHGTLEVVSTHGAPASLVCRVPEVMSGESVYAIWVGLANQGWSHTILVNDPRPAWFSPNEAFAGAPVKVVGQNLDPWPAATGHTRVRLTGPSTYELAAANDGDPATAIEKYAAAITLPSEILPGVYSAEVSRDGMHWATLEGQTLTVLPPAPSLPQVDAASHGAVPDDGIEDTSGIQAALDAAASIGGGEVLLAPGTYDVQDLTLPQGVSLAGAGKDLTRLNYVREATHYGMGYLCVVLTAHGNQTVRDLEIRDPLARIPPVNQSAGILPGNAGVGANHVTITRCRFTGLMFGITSWGIYSAIEHLTVTGNEFRNREMGLGLTLTRHSRICDNDFWPVSSESTWVWPSEFSGCEYVEFSDNSADGTVNGGWRNSYFWNLFDKEHWVLVSGNVALNTGGARSGNGEPIGLDANGNIVAYDGRCLSATSASVTIPAAWSTEDEYSSLWVRIVDGRGLGQSRRIESHTAGALNRLDLSEPWDVLPDETSWLVVSRSYWHMDVVDNTFDNRSAGVDVRATELGFVGHSTDCAIEGNTLYRCGGIGLAGQYTEAVPYPQSATHYFDRIEGNFLRDEGYLERSGIIMFYGASAMIPSPVQGYGVVVKSNDLVGCSYPDSAISILNGWWSPSSPRVWEETLVFGNRISDSRVAVALQPGWNGEAYVPKIWNCVLADNQCTDVETPVADHGVNTVILYHPDQDGDGISDALENSGDPDGDGTPNFGDSDSDADGLPDVSEGMQDVDHDALPNYLDTDSDDDSLLDFMEGMGDPDGDGLANYLDPDSDGDGVPDETEHAFGTDPYDIGHPTTLPVGALGLLIALGTIGACVALAYKRKE